GTFAPSFTSSRPLSSIFPLRLALLLKAKDGIRPRTVTRVQTCALPILPVAVPPSCRLNVPALASTVRSLSKGTLTGKSPVPFLRSEERRVGKECRSRGAPLIKRKTDALELAWKLPSFCTWLCYAQASRV